MKKKKLLSVFVAAALSLSLFFAVPIVSQAEGSTGVTMYRLYNPNSGEHFYTSNSTEKDNLVTEGWSDEGIGWVAPEKSNTPVYRLYNANAGDHHYTMDAKERDNLISAGWKDEGTGWYSDDDKTVPLYREYNPNAVTGTHNYTTDKAEHDSLVNAGWKDEGIGWYGIGNGKTDPPKDPDDDTLKVGDIVILGAYEQDNDLTNGSEPIEWQYVADRGGRKLLLSKYALECKKFNEEWKDITWEDCTLRSWLNNDFYNNAFSSSDKKRIVTAHNENPDSYELFKPHNISSTSYGAKGGNATNDNVFLLSWTEARDYLGGKLYDSDLGAGNYNQKLLCKPTAYAKAKGVWTFSNSGKKYPEDTAGCCWWWLRSPGAIQSGAASVGHRGDLDGITVLNDDIGVRPAILID